MLFQEIIPVFLIWELVHLYEDLVPMYSQIRIRIDLG